MLCLGMDIYSILRMFRNFKTHKPSANFSGKSNVVIFYAGNAHVQKMEKII